MKTLQEFTRLLLVGHNQIKEIEAIIMDASSIEQASINTRHSMIQEAQDELRAAHRQQCEWVAQLQQYVSQIQEVSLREYCPNYSVTSIHPAVKRVITEDDLNDIEQWQGSLTRRSIDLSSNPSKMAG